MNPHPLMKSDIRRHHRFILGGLLILLLIGLGIWQSPAGRGIAQRIVQQPPAEAPGQTKPQPQPVTLAPAVQPFLVQGQGKEEGEGKAIEPLARPAPAPAIAARDGALAPAPQDQAKAAPNTKETQGEVEKGERLPVLAIDSLDTPAFDLLMRHGAVRLIAQVRRGQKDLALLIPSSGGQPANLGPARPLTLAEAAGLSTRNFPLPAERPPVSPELLEYRVKKWLTEQGIGDAEGPYRYELRLAADFDRRLAQLQRQALDQVGIKPGDPRYTSAKTRLRLQEDAKGLHPRIDLE